MSDYRAALLGQSGTRQRGEVTVAGVTYPLRSVFADEYAKIEAKLTAATMAGRDGKTGKHEAGLATANALIIQLHVCDDEGNPLFSAEDLDALRKLPNSTTQAIVSACLKLSGIDGADLETLAKN